jgi:hypothetical protein
MLLAAGCMAFLLMVGVSWRQSVQVKEEPSPAEVETSAEPVAVREHAEASSTEACSWRAEALVGSCVGGPRKTVQSGTLLSATRCQAACCEDEHCVSWQFRASTGCFHGTPPPP